MPESWKLPSVSEAGVWVRVAVTGEGVAHGVGEGARVVAGDGGVGLGGGNGGLGEGAGAAGDHVGGRGEGLAVGGEGALDGEGSAGRRWPR